MLYLESIFANWLKVKKSLLIEIISIFTKYNSKCFAVRNSGLTLWLKVVMKFLLRVNFDAIFWKNVLPKLERFFDNIMLPELAYPRVKYGLCYLDLGHEL